MTAFHSFACGSCGGSVQLHTGPGRTYAYRRGVTLPVPDDFAIPTCTECGEEYLTVERAEELAALLRPVFGEMQSRHCREVVERIQATHGVSLRDIERACGVTGTYLSHVMAGRKEASDTLVHLLEAYALAPAEFRRRHAGVSWDEAVRTAGSLWQRVPMREVGAVVLGADHPPLRVVEGSYEHPQQNLQKPASDLSVAA